MVIRIEIKLTNDFTYVLNGNKYVICGFKFDGVVYQNFKNIFFQRITNSGLVHDYAISMKHY